MVTLNGRIQVRRGTVAEFTAADPVLALGEFAVATTGEGGTVLRIGDGTRPWTALTGVDPEVLAAALSSLSQGLGGKASTEALETLAEVVDSLAPGSNVTALLGDSLMAHNNIFDAGGGTYYIPASGWFWWANARLRGALPLLLNAGVPGDRTEQIRARVGAVIESGARIVVEDGGTNDVDAERSAASIITNRTATQDALLAAGMKVVAAEIPPRNGWSTAQRSTARAVNAWLAERAATVPDIAVAHWWRAVVDPATSNPAAGMTFDGIHFTSLGASRVGVETAAALAQFVTPLDRLSTSNGDQGNLLSNGAMIGPVVPTGWTLETNINNVEAVYSQRKRPAGDGGPDWWEVDLTSGRVRHRADATSGFAVGDKVVAIVEFDGEEDSTAFTTLQCTLRALNSGGSTIRQHIALADSYSSAQRAPLPGAVLDTLGYPLTIPAGTTSLRFIVEVGGTGTRHRVRRASIVKVA